MNTLAPIALFTYKRLETLKKTVLSLRQNYFASESELYIFSDGAKTESEKPIIALVREYIRSISGFRKIIICESPKNNGLANSIIYGVTNVLNKHGKVIVIEDDLVSSKNFLVFMNEALNFYSAKKEVFSISGYTVPIKNIKHDVYFTKRASSWGWATWHDRWATIDWQIKNYEEWKRKIDNRLHFNSMGSDMSKLLRDQMKGKINSWAIRFIYNQFLQKKYTVYPTISKIDNIGMGINATHTKDNFNRFKTYLDNSNTTNFSFPEKIQLNKHYLKQFLKQFSIATRAKYKILNYLFHFNNRLFNNKHNYKK